MRAQTVVIVGAGIVGRTTGQVLRQAGHSVTLVDVEPAARALAAQEGLAVSDHLDPISSGSVVMICVPTPADEHGYQLQALESVIRAIGGALATDAHDVLVVVRSTVPPGTCEGPVAQWLREASQRGHGDGYDIVCMPEFLREAHAIDDATEPRVTVIASPSATARQRMADLMQPLGGTLHLSPQLAEAEMIKCAHNAFNATKISFWNEMHDIAVRFGVDPTAVAAAVSTSAEGSWNIAYGTEGGRPYGGRCLPKDVRGFAGHVAAAGFDPVLLHAVDQRNERSKLQADPT